MKWPIHHGKQVHAVHGFFEAAPHGVEFYDMPRTSYLYDLLFDNKHPYPPEHYVDSYVSLGTPGDKEFFCKKTDISKGGVIRAPLGPGAGYQEMDTPSRLYWHYSGRGMPSSGRIHVLALIAFL